ncbi:MAG: hypothetical protein IKM62_00185 [Kiritimatiellae bacterium]|nr:hypothetical protein [Kiritimatiellia bacterium]
MALLPPGVVVSGVDSGETAARKRLLSWSPRAHEKGDGNRRLAETDVL